MLLEVAHREPGQHDGSPGAACLQLGGPELAINTLHSPADVKLPRSQIDVIPAQGEQLAAAEAGRQRQHVQGFQPLAVDDFEQAPSLREIQAQTAVVIKAAPQAAPLARRQRRALPLSGPPGARRATRNDPLGSLRPCGTCLVTQLAAMSSPTEGVTAHLGTHGSQRHGRPERPAPGPIHPRSTEGTQGPWSSGAGKDSPCVPL